MLTRVACLFCEIVQKTHPAHVIVEDDFTLGFLDTKPVFPGHVLLVTKPHIETLADLDTAHLAPLFANVQRVMRALETSIGAEGTFVAVNNKISQSVPHLHVHIVPRRKKDGLRGFFWPRQRYASDDDMATLAAKIREAMS